MKLTMNVNLSDWELGDWPDQLRDCVTMRVDTEDGDFDHPRIVIELDEDKLTETCRRIAKEAIDAFFNSEDIDFRFEDDGLHLKFKHDERIVLYKEMALWLGSQRRIRQLGEALNIDVEDYIDHTVPV